ncbi:MAG: hypothetical protein J6A79_05820 [Clostridia bacterium]|nr:hypothetical protein [Clostridia bacterium]
MGEGCRWVKSAAAHQHICGTYCSGVMEGCSQVVLIIFLQEGTVNDTDYVLAVIVPIAFNQVSGDGLQLKGKAGPAGRAEAFLQRGADAFLMLRPVFP